MKYAVGFLVAFSAVTAVECFLLLGQVRVLISRVEQLLTAGEVLLDQVPGKSAPRTEAADDDVALPRYPRLRLLAALRELTRDLAARPGVGPETTVKDALTADPAVIADLDTDVIPAVGGDQTPTETTPSTQPAPRLDVAGGLRVSDTEEMPAPPVVDDVDAQLVRFGLRAAARGDP